jgi:Extended Signal Peptide of Type V secretion system
MNAKHHCTIYNHTRGYLMAVAETAKSNGKASDESRPTRQSKPKTPTCRKARSALSSDDMWLQANQGAGYSTGDLVIA